MLLIQRVVALVGSARNFKDGMRVRVCKATRFA